VRRRPFLSVLLIASVVALADLVVKLAALVLLGERRVDLTSWLGLGVHFNEHLAWGLTAGDFPALVTAAATIVILGIGWLVARDLTRVDGWAPVALGLLAGAGIANAFDGLVPPRGAVDFIIVAHSGMETVLNGADLAVMAGVALCCRTAVLLGMAIDRQRTRPVVPAAVVIEREVPVPLHAEVRERLAPGRTPEVHRRSEIDIADM
jgi:lipoprotein signal peptidase